MLSPNSCHCKTAIFSMTTSGIGFFVGHILSMVYIRCLIRFCQTTRTIFKKNLFFCRHIKFPHARDTVIYKRKQGQIP